MDKWLGLTLRSVKGTTAGELWYTVECTLGKQGVDLFSRLCAVLSQGFFGWSSYLLRLKVEYRTVDSVQRLLTITMDCPNWSSKSMPIATNAALKKTDESLLKGLDDPKVRAKLDQARRRWNRKTVDVGDQVKKSQRISEADLAIRINATL
jgi:hypothetical protein